MKFKPPPHDCIMKFFRLDFDAKEGIQLVLVSKHLSVPNPACHPHGACCHEKSFSAHCPPPTNTPVCCLRLLVSLHLDLAPEEDVNTLGHFFLAVVSPGVLVSQSNQRGCPGARLSLRLASRPSRQLR